MSRPAVIGELPEDKNTLPLRIWIWLRRGWELRIKKFGREDFKSIVSDGVDERTS